LRNPRHSLVLNAIVIEKWIVEEVYSC